MELPKELTRAQVEAALQPNCPSPPVAELNADRELKAKLRFMAIASEVCPGFSLEERQKPVINDLFRWCLRLPGSLDPDKGLWIWGSIGTGKSTLMRIINQFCYEMRPGELIGNNRYTLPFCLRIRRAIDICDAYAEKGSAGLKDIINIERLCIDDIGTEGQVASYYGNATNVVGDLILRRYDMRRRFQTHATANLTPDDVRRVYGDRVFDRLGEMFNFVFYPGFTHRPGINQS